MVVKLTSASPLVREIGWGKSVSQANYSPSGRVLSGGSGIETVN